MKLKKGDQIIVNVGKDKGRKGKIEKVFPELGKILVPGINVYKKNMKHRDEKHPGGIIEKLRPLDLSKVALVCPHCNMPTRIGYLVVKGEKERVCRKCKQKI
jgi:large subunit ribosomal protein L24